MTTPTIDFVMPYGVTVEGDGSWYPKIVGDHPKKVTSAGVSLPAGPCRVAFSWDGEQSAELVLVNGDNVKRPARLEAKRGGVHVLRWSPSGPRKGTGWKSTRNASAAKLALSRCTRPTSTHSGPQGGGVDDHADGNRLDALAGHQACHDGGQHPRRDSGRARAERHGLRFLAPGGRAPVGPGFRRGPVDVHLPRVENLVWDAGTAQGPHCASHHGHGGDCETVRLDGGPVETHLARNHHLSDSCVLATTSTGGGR